MSRLMLPGDPGFAETLATPPPNWRSFAAQTPNFAFVTRAESGLLEPVNQADLTDYLYGGEYDDRLESIDDNDNFEAFEG